MTETTPTTLYENGNYAVRVVEDALDEDNRSRCVGYGIFNTVTGVREATGLVFGQVRWQTDQFVNMLRELDERAAAQEAAESDAIDIAEVEFGEDVVPS